MIALRLPLYLFIGLRAGFETADNDDAPIDPAARIRVRQALAEAAATTPPGLPTVLILDSAEDLFALSGCWEVGGECHPSITDDQWHSINTLINEAAGMR